MRVTFEHLQDGRVGEEKRAAYCALKVKREENCEVSCGRTGGR